MAMRTTYSSLPKVPQNQLEEADMLWGVIQDFDDLPDFDGYKEYIWGVFMWKLTGPDEFLQPWDKPGIEKAIAEYKAGRIARGLDSSESSAENRP